MGVLTCDQRAPVCMPPGKSLPATFSGTVRMQAVNPIAVVVQRMVAPRAAGVLFTCPYIFYQIWRFIAPGLSGGEKRLVLPFVFCATLFFLAGSPYVCRMMQLFLLSVLYFFIGCYAVSAAMSVIGYWFKSRERKRRVKWYRKQRTRG